MSMEISVVGNRIMFYKFRVDCKIPQPPAIYMPEEYEEAMRIERVKVKGKAKRYGVGTNIRKELEESFWFRFIKRFEKYRIEPYGLLCYNEEELADIESGLRELGIQYTVTNISPNTEQLTRAAEIDGKIGSRTEALDYIIDRKLPQRIAYEKDFQELKKRVDNIEKGRI